MEIFLKVRNAVLGTLAIGGSGGGAASLGGVQQVAFAGI